MPSLHHQPLSPHTQTQLFSNAFAALPAELGPDGKQRVQHTRKFMMFGMSKNRAALAQRKQAVAQRKAKQQEERA